ncbi:hypothetical protein B0H13DRAFT_2354153 [Mycena leptocephala]|nr:hypothetical protein B0H13DRAFT_2354153 [Mycena leptocephala]
MPLSDMMRPMVSAHRSLIRDFLQGMLTVQAYIYYEPFPQTPRTQSLVAVVWVLDLAHLVFICHLVYHYLITSWGNDAALLQSTEDFDLLVVLVGQ